MVFNIVFCWLLFYVMLEFIIKKRKRNIEICAMAPSYHGRALEMLTWRKSHIGLKEFT